MLAHQLFGPLPDFVSQIGQARRVEMPGGHLQMLGPFFGRQITLGTGSLRSAPLRTRSLEVGTLGAGTKWTASLRARTLGTGALITLRATGLLVGTTGTVWAIAQLLQPALGFTHRTLHFFNFRSGGLPFHQLALPDAQFIEMPFDLLPFALAHLLHPPAWPHPLGTISRPTITGPSIFGTPISRTAIARAPLLRTAPLGTPVLHPASFTRSAIPPTAVFRSLITWPPITGSPITWPRSAIAWAALRTGGGTGSTATVVNQLLLGGQLGFRPHPTGITRRILRQSSQQTNSQSQPQIPRHARSSRCVSCEP